MMLNLSINKIWARGEIGRAAPDLKSGTEKDTLRVRIPPCPPLFI